MTEKKNGLIIGYLSDGMLNVKWLERLDKGITRCVPSGTFWSKMCVEGTGYKEKGGYAAARTKVVEKAMEANAQWLLFLDSDVFAPDDIIPRLMSHGKDIVTGVYYMKTQPAQPVIFQEMGEGPYWNYPVDELFEIGGAGLGCTLINMDVFDKFKEAGLPFFKENWEYTKPNGAPVKVNVGEDHWFFIKAKELGVQPYCDSSVICDHIDYNNKVVFPGEKEVAKIREKVLKKNNATHILQAEEKLFALDSNKKTVVFFNAVEPPISGDEIEKRPVGGAETAIINIAKNLAKEHNVIVFGQVEKQNIVDGVTYVNISNGEWMKKFKTDLLIVVRNSRMASDLDFKKSFNVDKAMLWMHDTTDSPAYSHFDDAMKKLDGCIALSTWHKDHILEAFPNTDPNKITILRNGVDTKMFGYDGGGRNSGKIIYSSTPYRGLGILLDVFPDIKKAVPHAELHVYSSLKVYGLKKPANDFSDLYEKASNMDGVIYHGSVLQSELAEAQKSASLLAYPSIYKETSCITILEAISACTPVVTSNLAALPEALPSGCGALLDHVALSRGDTEDFKKMVIECLSPETNMRMMRKCEGIKGIDWTDRANDWNTQFFGHKLPEDAVPEEKPQEPDIEPEIKQKENINTPEYWDNQYKFEWDKKIEQRMDETRFNLILDKIPQGAKVLDYGCGLGSFFAHTVKKRGDISMYGIDMSPFAVKKAKERVPEIRATATSFGGTQLPQKFNVITLQHVIEHVDDTDKLIEELRSHLTDDGLLVVVIPINDDEWREHQKIYQIKDAVKLFNNFNCMYNIIHRERTIRRKPDGTPVQEAIVFVKFE